MNIEEAKEYLKLKIKNDNLTIQGMFGDIYEEIQKDNKAIETLLTAYEKEKGENKRLRKCEEALCEMQDKIKAKIEEVKDGTFDAKIVLQSLLEKCERKD